MEEDELWLFNQRTSELRAFVATLRQSWDDEAARQIHMRYLAPQESDANDMTLTLASQLEQIHIATSHLKRSDILFAEVMQCSEVISSHLSVVQRELQTSHQYQEVRARYRANALGLFKTVHDNIAEADCACNNVPREV